LRDRNNAEKYKITQLGGLKKRKSLKIHDMAGNSTQSREA